MSKNKMYDGLVYVNEIDRWVPIEEFVKNVKKIIECIDGAKVDYINRGSDSEYPYIKCKWKVSAEEVVRVLSLNIIPCELDCYEDDDGAGDGGSPTIREIWSVKFNFTEPSLYDSVLSQETYDMRCS